MAITNVQNIGNFPPTSPLEPNAKTVAQTGASQPGRVDGKPVIFVNMEEYFIKGERKESGILLTDARQKARFNRLFDMNKSFLPLLEKTGMEKSLK